MKLMDYLLERGYTKIKLHLTKTNHFEILAKINGKKGRFILDTGASNSCIGFDAIDLFNLEIEESNIKAAGAGSSDMQTMLSPNNKVKIGDWKKSKVALILFNLTHVNKALETQNAKTVQGIIGADLLQQGDAVIDYGKKYLYLKL
ncbi:MAG: retropepsin-like aspartic protease [bacterium]